MENPLKKYIDKIKTGKKEEIKEAQKQIEKYWHEVYIPDRPRGEKEFSVFVEEIKNFDKIQDIDRKAKFISTLKWPFLVIGREYFEDFSEFILKYIQHPSGKIRQAVINVCFYLVIQVTWGVKGGDKECFFDEEKKKNIMLFGRFVDKAEALLEKYYEPRFRPYKYISSLPPSVYKSLQKLIIEQILRSKNYEDIYNEYKVNSVTRERISDYYYDAMEATEFEDYDYAIKLLEKAIEIDEHYVEAYVGLVIVYELKEDKETAKKYVDIAFDKTKRVFPEWPERMPWGVIENRQYMRAIQSKASLDLELLNDKRQAKELYGLLLKMNPNDNQGIRFLLAGLYVGLSREDIDRMTIEGNKKQNWEELDNLLEEQNKIHKFWEPPRFD